MLDATADISDDLGDAARIAAPGFTDYGGLTRFSGPITTVKCFEDNSLVREALQEPGQGRVLVVDGGGSMRCALLGDILATLAADNGWTGVVVNGCIRDSAEIKTIQVGVKALATHPMKSHKYGEGRRDVAVQFAGIKIAPGEYLYADMDGIIITSQALQATEVNP
jgi:regulator of ribonuclease activity A